jgi:hypothetical protein
MGAPTSSYTTASIALRVSGALKPHHHHHNKVETPSVGCILSRNTIIVIYHCHKLLDLIQLSDLLLYKLTYIQSQYEFEINSYMLKF